MELKYHSQAMRLLDHKPTLSVESIIQIRESERESRAKLPAAVREWYSLEGVEQALAERAGACGPTSLEEILERIAAARRWHSPLPRPPRIVLFTAWSANTGWEAELLLDGSDDPPVEADAEPPVIPFTHYILNMAWWRQTFNDQPSKLYGRRKKEPPAVCGPPHLDFLSEHFEEASRNCIPWHNFVPDPSLDAAGPRTFRFFRPGWYVEVGVDGDPTTGFRPALYSLTADTKEQLEALDEFVWPCRAGS